jgi:hypothetical protein
MSVITAKVPTVEDRLHDARQRVALLSTLCDALAMSRLNGGPLDHDAFYHAADIARAAHSHICAISAALDGGDMNAFAPDVEEGA